MVKFLNIALIQILLLLFVAIDLDATALNVIDKCSTANKGDQLAQCSVGFAGKMSGNMGSGVTQYKVTDPSDDPLSPKPGTLRYGVTLVKGKKWITFSGNLKIGLQRPLRIPSFTTIDGRGASVKLTGPGCLIVYKANDVIIHGLEITGCKPFEPIQVMGPESKPIFYGQADADGIGLVGAKKVWIDHNTLYGCEDGLIDITVGSTDVTISNNWFKDNDKVMLLGHDDACVEDKAMRVTIVLNRFGPNVNQRIPRIRHGYAHVANNYYQGWVIYAIGGSKSPNVKSESNHFIPTTNKNVCVPNGAGNEDLKEFYTVNDFFEGGAVFGVENGPAKSRATYSPDQTFAVADAKAVKDLTASAGASAAAA